MAFASHLPAALAPDTRSVQLGGPTPGAWRVRVGKPMPGVFEVDYGLPLGAIIEDILRLVECSLDGEWEGQTRYLPLR